MTISAQSMTGPVAQPVAARARDWWELGKPRLSLMTVLTALLGYLASAARVEAGDLLAIVGGMTLAAFGAAALNQAWEFRADARMARTRDRPVAAGRLGPEVAAAYGLLLSALGVAWLGLAAGWLAAGLTAATVGLYILVYTPLKRVTPVATEVGAVAGALPPLIGWTVGAGGLGLGGWLLFALLFAWQMPHFLAISHLYREDYMRGGFRMWSAGDPTGKRVAALALGWGIVLVAVSLLPWLVGLGSWLLLVAAAGLGIGLLKKCVAFTRGGDRRRAARDLFVASVLYLPLYLIALVGDHLLLF